MKTLVVTGTLAEFTTFLDSKPAAERGDYVFAASIFSIFGIKRGTAKLEIAGTGSQREDLDKLKHEARVRGLEIVGDK